MEPNVSSSELTREQLRNQDQVVECLDQSVDQDLQDSGAATTSVTVSKLVASKTDSAGALLGAIALVTASRLK